jgi:hypothetical protein
VYPSLIAPNPVRRGYPERVLRIGTSGWQYRDWRGPFCPDGLPQRLWLECFAERFATVEVNNAAAMAALARRRDLAVTRTP